MLKEYLLNEWNEDTGGMGKKENIEKGKCRQELWCASSMLYLLSEKAEEERGDEEDF